jgi:putative transposase
MTFAKDYSDFLTATCLEWYYLLEDDGLKDLIIDSLRFLAKAKRVNVFAFCIMNNQH